MTRLDALPDSLRAFPPLRRYLVGVSGGRDSVALLHWLLERGYKRLVVCHLDHQLRGAAARGDAQFVRRLAEKWELPCEMGRADVSASKASSEAAGRAARLEFFMEVARRRRCRTIFIGHHADDQVETFLMQLFRGAGGRGLGAMREVSRIGSLQIVRPFLGAWRSEIDAYVAEHRLKFREDASNAELGARRNRVRHQIVPELEKKFGRKLRTNLWRAANVLAEEDAFLETLLPNEWADADTLSTQALKALPLSLQRRMILRWLRAHALRDVGYEAVEEIRGLLAPEARVAKINLPDDRHVRRRAGKLFLE
ncbi:MAG TPA: tRNA lysidine(34) synthetase TilS [Chthoniobacterales bacterium]|jgi:tRNA(Ile)-lysidine synthase